LRPAPLTCVLLAIAVTALAWGAVPWGAFQFDDFRNVVRDPATTDYTVLLERLPHGLRPLTRLSYFLDAQLYGVQPAGFLSTNLLLHATTVLLVFALARRRLDSSAALAAALLFAVQPANAEVVAYISGRSTGLMTPLLLGGLLLYDGGKRVSALLLFCLACLAKEHALIFPALVLAWELTRSEPRSGVLRDVAITIVLAGILAVALLGTDAYRTLLAYSVSERSIGDNVLANARAIPQMVSLWVRPWALSVDHEFDPRLHLGASIAGLALLLAAAAIAFLVRRRRPMLSLAIAWPLIALLPTNSILAKPDLVTEKPLYLAWAGVAIALGAAVPALTGSTANRVAQRVLRGVAGLVLCALIGASVWRASVWRDPIVLWTDAVAKAPYKSRCWNNFGMANLAAGREPEALAAFERAVLLDPANEYASLNLATARALCGSGCPGR
jgi:protein O-mannosyl-transferase